MASTSNRRGSKADEQPETEPDTAKVAEQDVTTTTPTPVHTFILEPPADEMVRAGGHVLTDAGWVVEETGEPVGSEEDDES